MSKARNIARLLLSNSGVVPVNSIQSVNAASITSQLSHRSLTSGQSLQVQSTFYGWYSTLALNTSWQNVPNMSVTITPKFASSRLRIDVRWFGEVASAWDTTFGISRNGTIINLPIQDGTRFGCLGMPNQSYVQDDNDSTPEFSFFSTIDAPNTTAPITYTMVARSEGAARTLWSGRVISGATTGNYEQGSLGITVTEYAT